MRGRGAALICRRSHRRRELAYHQLHKNTVSLQAIAAWQEAGRVSGWPFSLKAIHPNTPSIIP
ncbi:unknown protein [Desulfotalea psychrophila LSv54]|uniref:Uncharacterized protein n=1 Tax=Desulfotalea psychrophila (strain LSv54 / DSM 12343) TaxID=177439 RepID=Q6APL1_DESPS|nr:unknown protein [Desulfotalea psychrophila LSv54]